MSNFRYYYTNREANFGKPLRTEVSGGSHLTIDVILLHQRIVYALRLPEGLHGDRKNGLYFPHGLIRFGESLLECVDRLCQEFVGISALAVQTYSLASWVDDNDHWHLCLNAITTIGRPPTPGGQVSEVVPVTLDRLPDEFPWWTVPQMTGVLKFIRGSEMF
jgi:hypothetical protein